MTVLFDCHNVTDCLNLVMSKISKLLGEKIKICRHVIYPPMSSENLAAIVGISRQSMSRIESGVQMPSATTLKNIADALNVSIDLLMNEKIPPIVVRMKILNREFLEAQKVSEKITPYKNKGEK